MEELSVALGSTAAVFLSDVDGLYTGPPRHDPTARLIRAVAVSSGCGRCGKVNTCGCSEGFAVRWRPAAEHGSVEMSAVEHDVTLGT